MRRYLQLMICLVFYNAVALILDASNGRPIHAVNVVGLVLCSAAAYGQVILSRRLSAKEQVRLLRRISVFLLGGFICPKCGDARVRLGGRYLFCFTCPNCDELFFLRGEPGPGPMWRAVWRRYGGKSS